MQADKQVIAINFLDARQSESTYVAGAPPWRYRAKLEREGLTSLEWVGICVRFPFFLRNKMPIRYFCATWQFGHHFALQTKFRQDLRAILP